MEGFVVKFDEERGFGFIRSKAASEDIFVHIREIRGQQNLVPGQNVSFNTKQTDRGVTAMKVIPVKKRTSPYYLYGSIALFIVATIAFLLIYKGLHFIPSYLIAINLTTFLFYGYDKLIAGKTFFLRVPEWILHSLAIFGGSPTGLIAQKLFHHKTIKRSFQLVYWLIVIVQLAIIGWFVYEKWF